MPIVDRLRKLVFGSEERKAAPRSIPSIVRVNTDVKDFWILQNEIGDGAFGKVYKAVSKADNNLIAAAKMMELEDDEQMDVMVEVEILCKCKHPNIVQLYDAFTMGNTVSLMIEFCGGGAIDNIMMELSRGLTEPQIHCVMKEVLKALIFLHQNYIIHRDLKAGNVLLTSDARVKLADFGVSAICRDSREGRSSFIGTSYWMAPEVMYCETTPQNHYNQLCDIWSFGITLIEMAEEAPPYADMNPAKVVFKVIKASPPTLQQPSLWSKNFNDVIARCLTKDPQKRPAAADIICHPFFEKEGDVACVRQLICEINADEVTTEVVESEYDEEEDDTSSSVDIRFPESLSKENNVDLSSHVYIGQEALSEATTSVPKEFSVSSRNICDKIADEETTQIPSPNSHSSAIDALRDLDQALDLGSVIANGSEKPPTRVTITQGEHKMMAPNPPRSPETEQPSQFPTHQIRDILESVIAASPAMKDNAEVVAGENSEAKDDFAEVSQSAYFEKQSSSQQVVGTIDDVRSSVPGSLSVIVGKSEDNLNMFDRKTAFDIQHLNSMTAKERVPDRIFTYSTNAGHPKRLKSTRSVDSSTNTTETISPHHRSSSQPIHSSEESSNVEIHCVSEAGMVRPGAEMLAVFKVVPPANREPSLVKVRRPTSFPSALEPSAPACFASDILDPPLSASSSIAYIEGKKLKNCDSEKVIVTLRPSHELTPTTSRSSQFPEIGNEAANYDYFGTTVTPNIMKGDVDAAAGEKTSPSQTVQNTLVFTSAPPPEPPIDYDSSSFVQYGRKIPERNEKKSQVVSPRKSPHRQTVTRKTRVYVVDGVQMTSTSHQVFGVRQDFELRKQQLHELRRLQREEARQQRELIAKSEAQRNELTRRFAADKENVLKESDNELQALARNHKRQLKDAEDAHNEDMKQSLKRLQADQEREMRGFKEALKHERKQLQNEIDLLPKYQRKEAFRIRKEQLDIAQRRSEEEFLLQQQKNREAMEERVRHIHQLKICSLEKKLRQQQHAVLRTREASMWNLEERQLAEKRDLYKQELKERFHLQRTQMLARHQRELEHMRKVNAMNEEEAQRTYMSYKKKLPKDFRTESKARINMFKESLRISCQGDDVSVINEKMRAFEEKEKRRMQNAIKDHVIKAERRLAELVERNIASVKELEEIHNMKRKMLLETEQSKLENFEREFEKAVADWKSDLPFRKQKLEVTFAQELEKLDAFYRKENAQLQSTSCPGYSSQQSF
ncbi:hypothetical protein AB6A40_001164 [Gnathostoma spinigerum]|uniref:Protein kinase domain-containing protein n=1 Tax=Gnathostoma spinigerum TaxID=75299 RepID=A0ABD6E4K3_9BILA